MTGWGLLWMATLIVSIHGASRTVPMVSSVTSVDSQSTNRVPMVSSVTSVNSQSGNRMAPMVSSVDSVNSQSGNRMAPMVSSVTSTDSQSRGRQGAQGVKTQKQEVKPPTGEPSPQEVAKIQATRAIIQRLWASAQTSRFQYDKENQVERISDTFYLHQKNVIGEGAFGRIYKFGDLVLKEIKDEGESTTEEADGDENEGQLIAKKILEDAGQKLKVGGIYPKRIQAPSNLGPRTFYLMALLVGKNLFELCANVDLINSMDFAEMYKIMEDGVKALHAKSYYHRDLNPKNWMVSGTGKDLTVYLIDFGRWKRSNEMDLFATEHWMRNIKLQNIPETKALKLMKKERLDGYDVHKYSIGAGVVVSGNMCQCDDAFLDIDRRLLAAVKVIDFPEGAESPVVNTGCPAYTSEDEVSQQKFQEEASKKKERESIDAELSGMLQSSPGAPDSAVAGEDPKLKLDRDFQQYGEAGRVSRAAPNGTSTPFIALNLTVLCLLWMVTCMWAFRAEAKKSRPLLSDFSAEEV